MQCGLLGRKLSHSYSPQIHKLLGDYTYSIFEIEPNELKSFLKSENFTGLNVTIPYKKDVIPFCDQLSKEAAQLGAVNTIVRQSDGTLIGHNTDYFGFHSMVKHSGLSVQGKKVLVLGSGGASVTAVAVLQELGAHVTVISRSGSDNYDNIKKHADASIIVNTTPVGMYPNIGTSPVDIRLIPHLEGVLDLIYNPARTKLLLDAEQRGLVAENGLWMLVAQAKESAQWFTGKTISDTVINAIYKDLRQQMENIVLVGMPGCGKSTIGIELAKKLGRTFIDTDAEIVAQSGMSIPQIFSKLGEAEFRQLETLTLAKFGKESGLVIATGGGCVTKEINYQHLHQNGHIIWLQRDIESLPTDGRPLSQASQLSEMYQIRKPLYESFSDLVVSNNSTPETAIREILKLEDIK